MNVVNSILTKYAEKRASAKPVAQLLRYEKVTPQVHKIVASLSFDGGLVENRAALASLFQGKATPVNYSFRQINTHNTEGQRIAVVGFVAANTLAQELTPEVEANFKEIAKNVLMDEHDNTMWQVHEHAGRKFIRRQHQEDLSELMRETASVQAHQYISRQYTEMSTLRVDCSGQFNVLAFVDPDELCVRYGYQCEEASVENGYNHVVLCQDSTDLVYVNENLVVQCAYNVDPNNTLHQAVKQHMETAGVPDVNTMKDYYARVYGYDPEYLKELFGEIEDQAKT
jgi:hypothetical protein